MTKSLERAAIAFVALAALLLWGYWPTLAEVVERWSTNPQYSHGYLVPAFAAFLLWHRREMVRDAQITRSWWGVPLAAFGVALHLGGAYFYSSWACAFSLLPTLFGLGLVCGGVKLVRWAWPALAFLVFMLPLPYRVEVGLAYPLQRLATLASTYLLQTIGLPAVAERSVIFMEHSQINVVEACNGFGMLMIFFAMAAAMAMLMRGFWLDKAIILLSAVPIALVANVLRIAVHGLLSETVGGQAADKFFHDSPSASLFMMALALGILWFEKHLLGKLLLQQAAEEPFTLSLPARQPDREAALVK